MWIIDLTVHRPAVCTVNLFNIISKLIIFFYYCDISDNRDSGALQVMWQLLADNVTYVAQVANMSLYRSANWMLVTVKFNVVGYGYIYYHEYLWFHSSLINIQISVHLKCHLYPHFFQFWWSLIRFMFSVCRISSVNCGFMTKDPWLTAVSDNLLNFDFIKIKSIFSLIPLWGNCSVCRLLFWSFFQPTAG